MTADRDRLASLLHAPCEARWARRAANAAMWGGSDVVTLHGVDAHFGDADYMLSAGVTFLRSEGLEPIVKAAYRAWVDCGETGWAHNGGRPCVISQHATAYLDDLITEPHEHGGGRPMREMTEADRG